MITDKEDQPWKGKNGAHYVKKATDFKKYFNMHADKRKVRKAFRMGNDLITQLMRTLDREQPDHRAEQSRHPQMG